MIVSRKSLITLPSIDCALRLWVNETVVCGSHGSGAVFCSTEKRRDNYLLCTSSVLPVCDRIPGSPVIFRLSSGADLSVHLIRNLQDAADVVENWPFIIIDDPVMWFDPRLLRFLTSRLKPRLGTRTTLVTVGSPLDLASVPVEQFDDVSTVKDIDYSAITRALST